MTLARHRPGARFRKRIWRLSRAGFRSLRSGNFRSHPGGLILPGVAALPITRMATATRQTSPRGNAYTSTSMLLIPATPLTAETPNSRDVSRLRRIYIRRRHVDAEGLKGE